MSCHCLPYCRISIPATKRPPDKYLWMASGSRYKQHSVWYRQLDLWSLQTPRVCCYLVGVSLVLLAAVFTPLRHSLGQILDSFGPWRGARAKPYHIQLLVFRWEPSLEASWLMPSVGEGILNPGSLYCWNDSPDFLLGESPEKHEREIESAEDGLYWIIHWTVGLVLLLSVLDAGGTLFHGVTLLLWQPFLVCHVFKDICVMKTRARDSISPVSLFLIQTVAAFCFTYSFTT